MEFRCLLGFHKWNKSREELENILENNIPYANVKCVRCGKYSNIYNTMAL